ncbi:hypothetical protein D3C75_1314180 [compost metagenome]
MAAENPAHLMRFNGGKIRPRQEHRTQHNPGFEQRVEIGEGNRLPGLFRAALAVQDIRKDDEHKRQTAVGP